MTKGNAVRHPGVAGGSSSARVGVSRCEMPSSWIPAARANVGDAVVASADPRDATATQCACLPFAHRMPCRTPDS
jgi:hypothetical protein